MVSKLRSSLLRLTRYLFDSCVHWEVLQNYSTHQKGMSFLYSQPFIYLMYQFMPRFLPQCEPKVVYNIIPPFSPLSNRMRWVGLREKPRVTQWVSIAKGLFGPRSLRCSSPATILYLCPYYKRDIWVYKTTWTLGCQIPVGGRGSPNFVGLLANWLAREILPPTGNLEAHLVKLEVPH